MVLNESWIPAARQNSLSMLFFQFRIFYFLYFLLLSENLFKSKLVMVRGYFNTGLLDDNQIKIENIIGPHNYH